MTTAARLVTVAEPGQIITTDRVTESLSGAAEAQVREAPNAANMEKRLQVRLFQICWGSATPAADSSDGLESGGAAEAVDGGGEEAPQPTSASGSGKGVPPSEAPAPSREGSLVDIGLDATEVLDLSALRAKDERRKTGATAIDESARAEAQRVTDESAPAGASSSEPTLCLIWRGQVLSIRSEEEAIHLGREDENEVVLDGDTASRLHAHLERRGDTFMLVDYSTNGTFVYDSEGNQKRIKEDQVELDTSGAISPGCPQDAVGSDPILFWVTGGKA
ncbi:MAG: FHA domain-containing protein [Lentisphaerae bacterium]|nr:FHA domain-containing protein [Lentisphaerota bacterium]MBT4820415.1 FHA domain-containing protein [Lentisphaerota bacterium]MBT5608877.1 FHA domain-containing protein [Lentisphaerota bacterium]MBT7057411.1 FHA domain-containing protein [Lentisphaerota bacterium]MBT7842743.1 FHA domain-containing protein [Lentisphaerota bacterium]